MGPSRWIEALKQGWKVGVGAGWLEGRSNFGDFRAQGIITSDSLAGNKSATSIGEPVVDLCTRQTSAVHQNVLFILRRVRMRFVRVEPVLELADRLLWKMSSAHRIVMELNRTLLISGARRRDCTVL